MKRELSLRRKLAFAAVCLIAALVGGELLIEAADRLGWIDTHRREDQAHYVEGALFQRTGDVWTNTEYGDEGMTRMEFAVDKGDGWRMFVLGASFAEGTPWGCCEPDGRERPGGLASLIRTLLQHRYDRRPLEVLPATTGGAASGRVAQVAEQVVDLEPDVLLVATCNNEGALTRDTLREELHQLGGYRFLTGLVAGEPDDAGRSYYTPQHADLDAVRADYRANLERILDAAGERGVTVMLATLPVNLRYLGFERGHSAEDGAWQYPTREVPANFWEAMNCADRGDYDRASEVLAEFEPTFPEFFAVRGQVRLATGDLDGGLSDMRTFWGDCLGDAFDAFYRERYAEAGELLERCDELPEVTRYRGLVAFHQGDHEEARRWLTQSVELLPSNRCRPSFNALIREVAASRDGVVLVDLERAAERASPGGVPGPELFVDYCHMTQYGYALMADEIVATAQRASLGLGDPVAEPMGWPELRHRLGLPDDSGAAAP